MRYTEESREKIFEIFNREIEKDRNNLFGRAQTYFEQNPRATKKDLIKEGLSGLLTITDCPYSVLLEYFGIAHQKRKKEPKKIRDEEYRRIESEIIEIVANNLSLEPGHTPVNLRFRELGEDELNLIELQMDIEDKYNLDFPEEDWQDFETIERIADYILKNRHPRKYIEREQTQETTSEITQIAG